MSKVTPIAYEIHDVLSKRWSPRAFSDRSVPVEVLRSLLEAARWAPSCFNEQPWRFMVARREQKEAFAEALSCLNEKNQSWAKEAGVLLMTAAKKTFSSNGNENAHSWHDVGLAVGMLTAQATALGLGMHQMAGFSKEKARETFQVPEGFEPVTMIAIGYTGDPEQLPEGLKEKELAPRTRHNQSAFVFSARWGESAVFEEEQSYERVLSFWFGDGPFDETMKPREAWWKKDPAFDQEIKTLFEDDYEGLIAGEREHWLQSARGLLAAIIVLDQFSRNMYRDTPKMYAADEHARNYANEMIAKHMDQAIGVSARPFIYMPLMHSENITDQEECVALFEALVADAPEAAKDALSKNLDFAKQHRDIVLKFGRFPHRNKIFPGRESTPEEEAFLKEPGSSF